MDCSIWYAKDLEKVVANPIEIMDNREKLVVGFSDQIPAWVNI